MEIEENPGIKTREQLMEEGVDVAAIGGGPAEAPAEAMETPAAVADAATEEESETPAASTESDEVSTPAAKKRRKSGGGVATASTPAAHTPLVSTPTPSSITSSSSRPARGAKRKAEEMMETPTATPLTPAAAATTSESAEPERTSRWD